MSKIKLNTVIGIEKGVKTRVTSEGGKLHRASQVPTKYVGHVKRWVPLEEDGEKFPLDTKKVELTSGEVLTQFAEMMSEYFDITLTKDAGNQEASADIVVGGEVLAKDVPATTLIFLEKQLQHVYTVVEKLPTLDDSEDWNYDSTKSLYRTDEQSTHRTKKIQKPIVLFPATEQHPAQTQLVSEDIIIGHWNTVKYSGAIPVETQKEILRKVARLQKAVKAALDEANSCQVDRREIGEAVFKYLFN